MISPELKHSLFRFSAGQKLEDLEIFELLCEGLLQRLDQKVVLTPFAEDVIKSETLG